MQNGLVDRNAGVPAERRIEFRVGIHLDDVVEESDGDLMGDGVNIAARLVSIATPGAICLSEDAFRHVRGRLDLAVSDLGLIVSRRSLGKLDLDRRTRDHDALNGGSQVGVVVDGAQARRKIGWRIAADRSSWTALPSN